MRDPQGYGYNPVNRKEPYTMNKANTVVIAYLPNKQGNYVPTKVPAYIQAILPQVRPMYDYTYKLVGVNPQRPGYGIHDDLSALEAWVKRYFADFAIKAVHEERKNYYGVFEMTDPVALQLEKAGLLR